MNTPLPCTTPEESVSRARSAAEDAVLTVFWTCAVFVRENDIFFLNSDTKPFLFQVQAPLDSMQLACLPDLAPILASPSNFRGRKIASHPSPAPLVLGLEAEIFTANSNADAAMLEAKESGRNAYKFYTAAMNERAMEQFNRPGALGCEELK